MSADQIYLRLLIRFPNEMQWLGSVAVPMAEAGRQRGRLGSSIRVKDTPRRAPRREQATKTPCRRQRRRQQHSSESLSDALSLADRTATRRAALRWVASDRRGPGAPEPLPSTDPTDLTAPDTESLDYIPRSARWHSSSSRPGFGVCCLKKKVCRPGKQPISHVSLFSSSFRF